VNRVLKRIFGAESEEVVRGRRISVIVLLRFSGHRE